MARRILRHQPGPFGLYHRCKGLRSACASRREFNTCHGDTMSLRVHILILVSIVIGGAGHLVAQDGRREIPVGASLSAQSPATGTPALGTMVNPDGSLNLDRGYSGSLDPTGWHM